MTSGTVSDLVNCELSAPLQVLIDLDLLNCFRRKRPSKKQYKRLHLLLHDSPSWPPLNQTLPPTDQTVISVR